MFRSALPAEHMMDGFYERLEFQAATVDELLSDAFETLPSQKADVDLAARRLAAWCRSCASGDWSLFERRLSRDALTFGHVLSRFAAARRKASVPSPLWIEDAIWIEKALQGLATTELSDPHKREPCAFEQLLTPVIEQAAKLLGIHNETKWLTKSARDSLTSSLLKQLSECCAPALYELFSKTRKTTAGQLEAAAPGRRLQTTRYDQFIADMKEGGFRRLFENKPVLLRIIATVTRQWIDTSRELIFRLHTDLADIHRKLMPPDAAPAVVVDFDSSDADRHNGGRSVQIVTFSDGSRVAYKPKDLRLDVAWRDLISRLNEAGPPIQLTTPRTIACNGYGWAEFINHAGCASTQNHKTFFQRAGAWLALFHCFAATDMHQENIIAAGDHPIPIDLETLFHVMLNENQGADLENNAMEVAKKKLAESVMAVGLLPAYGRSPENKIFAIGGMTAGWETTTKIVWSNINSDEMHPARAKITKANPNLPHADGRYAMFADYIDDFIEGFASYARFLSGQRSDLFRNFEGLTIRRVLRPTRFYYMLLQRLKNHQTMNDGVLWSVQSDFIARLTDWDQETDPLWAFLRSERLALTSLNVPLFVAVTDGHQVRDLTGFSTAIRTPSGLDRARNRVLSFDEKEISWQIEVIKQNTSSMQKSDRHVSVVMTDGLDPALFVSADDVFLSEAKAISDELSAYAIRRGNSAAWIGLDWLGDAEVFQLSCLGPDLYNGVSGIAVFLAAQAAVTKDASAGELALNAVASIRNDLKSRNAARFARSIGIGGATGLGSIIYALTVMSKSLQAPDLLAAAHAASELLTDDLITADKQLDVVGGCAGAILGLLRLYRDSGSSFAINRAIRCAEHLLSQPRIGAQQQRSWVGQGLGPDALNGMSHGAAGFAYALAKLSGLTGRQDFAGAASECMAFENSSYDEQHHNWPDKRAAGGPSWPCQWCHGAPGIGLARLGMAKSARTRGNLLFTDIQNAVEGTIRGWPGAVDTLCCGTLGSIEFLAEAGAVLQRIDLQELARQRLLAVLENAKSNGDYRWNSGNRRFNLGLFRGLAGVGYALLRRVDKTLPNILIWE